VLDVIVELKELVVNVVGVVVMVDGELDEAVSVFFLK
jgi:hypothetical protein